jgi:hypothetical protein
MRAIVREKFGVPDSLVITEMQIREAHRVMQANEARGKMVVVHN